MATYESEIEIIENTVGKDINLQAQDSDGNGVDLTACVVKWVVYAPEGTTPLWEVTCTAVDLTTGKVKYTLLAGDWGTNKPQGGSDYTSSLIADKTGYHEEFKNLKVTILTATPTT